MKPVTGRPPVTPLLGFFEAMPSEAAARQVGEEEEEDSLWLVCKWESLKPLGLYLQAGPPRPATGLFVNK